MTALELLILDIPFRKVLCWRAEHVRSGSSMTLIPIQTEEDKKKAEEGLSGVMSELDEFGRFELVTISNTCKFNPLE